MAQKEIKLYTLEEALKLTKEKSKAKFDATVEVHINLNIEKKIKNDVNIRFSTTLPNGTGKTKKVAVLASKKVANADLELMESDIEKLEKGTIRPKVDFDVLVAEPKFMPKLAKAAKVLGPAGVMPNPKTGTVTDNVEDAVTQVKKGKVELRTEKDNMVIHTLIGKCSFSEKALAENFYEIYNNLKQNKPAKASQDWIGSIYLSPTMGESYALNLSTL